MALARWAGAVLDVWRFGHRVTWSGLIRAADITAHLGLAATFSRTLDGGANSSFSAELTQLTLRHGSYLGPLGHLPLWTTGRALAGPPLHGPLQVGHGAEFTVDGAVQARRQHLPTPNLTKLETLPTGSRALAPAAGLPPEHEQTRTSSTFHAVYFFFPLWILPGLTFSADAEVVDRLRPGESITVHVMDLSAVIANTGDEGL